MITVLTITNSETSADLQEKLIAPTGNKFMAGTKLMKFVRGLMGGVMSAKVRTEVDAVAATGTYTFASVIATDAFAINGVTFTAKTSGATGNEFNVGASDTLTAAAAAAAINASDDMAGIVTASSALGVITITAARPGKIGNCITTTSADTTIDVSGAKLTGGTDGAVDKTHYYGSAS